MALVDFVFPRWCVGCGKKGVYFCPQCLKSIGRLERSICPECLKASIWGKTHASCLGRFSLDGLVTVFGYRGIVRKAVKKLKYRLVTDLVQELNSLVERRIKEGQGKRWRKFGAGWTLVPVPLHPRRKRWRGFNQAEVLGKRLAGRRGWQFEADLLVRQKPTKPQAEMKDKKRRRANVRGVFRLDRKLSGADFIVFDDVWTTGSTIKECGQLLKRAGARKVWGLTVAR
jgi:ComF family protein